MFRATCLACSILILMAEAATAQTVWKVDRDSPIDPNSDPNVMNDPNWGKTWPLAFLSLQTALDHTDQGHHVWVAAGSYHPSALHFDPNDGDANAPSPTDPRRAAFFIPIDVHVYGGFVGYDLSDPNAFETTVTQRNPTKNVTILDGNIGDPNDDADNAYHVVYFRDAPLSAPFTKLSGFTIQNGRADYAYPDIHGVEEPDESMGGGIYVKFKKGGATSPLLDRLIVRNNFALYEGGGISIASKEPIYITSCRFENNVVDGDIEFAAGAGGGVCARVHAPQSNEINIQNCVFFGNRVMHGSGGGMWGDAQLVNCTFAANIVDYDPNSAPASAYRSRRTAGQQTPRGTMRNCIVWGNGDSAAPQIYKPSVSFSDMEDNVNSAYWNDAGGNIQVDPLFVDPNGGGLFIRGGSPAIDAGDNTLILLDFTDLDTDGVTGFTNPNERTPWDVRTVARRRVAYPDPNDPNAIVDMGAYEWCRGDVDHDGDVDLTDLAIVLTHFGLSGCDRGDDCWIADIALNDGNVNLTDLATVNANFGTNCRQAPGEDQLMGGGSSSSALAQWLQTATLEELLAWYEAGMPTDSFGGEQ